jgi:hypothetical protein
MLQSLQIAEAMELGQLARDLTMRVATLSHFAANW